MQHTKYIAIGPLVLQKKIYEEVLPLWAWRPSRSYDPDPPNKLSFPALLRLQMKFCLNRPSGMFENVDDRRTTNAWLYYKLTCEPIGSCQLKRRSAVP